MIKEIANETRILLVDSPEDSMIYLAELRKRLSKPGFEDLGKIRYFFLSSDGVREIPHGYVLQYSSLTNLEELENVRDLASLVFAKVEWQELELSQSTPNYSNENGQSQSYNLSPASLHYWNWFDVVIVSDHWSFPDLESDTPYQVGKLWNRESFGLTLANCHYYGYGYTATKIIVLGIFGGDYSEQNLSSLDQKNSFDLIATWDFDLEQQLDKIVNIVGDSREEQAGLLKTNERSVNSNSFVNTLVHFGKDAIRSHLFENFAALTLVDDDTKILRLFALQVFGIEDLSFREEAPVKCLRIVKDKDGFRPECMNFEGLEEVETHLRARLDASDANRYESICTDLLFESIHENGLRLVQNLRRYSVSSGKLSCIVLYSGMVNAYTSMRALNSGADLVISKASNEFTSGHEALDVESFSRLLLSLSKFNFQRRYLDWIWNDAIGKKIKKEATDEATKRAFKAGYNFSILQQDAENLLQEMDRIVEQDSLTTHIQNERNQLVLFLEKIRHYPVENQRVQEVLETDFRDLEHSLGKR